MDRVFNAPVITMAAEDMTVIVIDSHSDDTQHQL